MSYSATDLANIETAIRAIIARLASGSKEIVRLSIGDKSWEYAPSRENLETLEKLKEKALTDIRANSGPRFFLASTEKGL